MSPTDHFGEDFGDDVWTLARIYEDLGARYEVARALNVSVRRVTEWQTKQPHFGSPSPVRVLGNVKIYSIQEWKDWYRRWLALHADNKAMDNTKFHGAGETFWEFFAKDSRHQ